MGNVHYVGAEPLTFERIEEILTGNMKLELTLEVKERIQRCRDYLDRKIETQSEPLYGITTGFGSLCNEVTKIVYFIGNERMLIAHDSNRLRFS